jgi:hypothetical protein
MKWFPKLAIAMSFLIGVTLSACPAQAAEPAASFQADTTSYLVSTEFLPVGDEDGHVLGLQKREGDVVMSSGETAKYLNVLNLDFRRGKGGTATGYSKLLFDDGSTIMFSWTCDITVDKGMFSKQGQGTIIKGTGRFAGLQGTAYFEGRQLKPPAQDPKMTATTTYYVTVQ